MATIEPGQLFQFDRPLERAVVDAVLIRDLFTALARTNYTTDSAYPASPRPGMLRVNAADPNNVTLDVYIGSPGAWRTVLRSVQVGVAAPVKQIIQITTAALTWTIDHNLGSQPLVQVFDTGFVQLRPGNPAIEDVLHMVGHVPFGLLTAIPPGPPVAVMSFVAPFNGLLTELVVTTPQGLTAPPVFTVDATIGGVPVPGTGIPIAAPVPIGTSLVGVAASGNTIVGGGSVVAARIALTAPPATGSFDVHARMKPTDAYKALHVNENRVVITHPIARQGFAVLIG